MRPRAAALNVRWFDGRQVGRVVTTGPTHFAYDDEWLANGYNLSPIALPFTNATFRQRADGFDQVVAIAQHTARGFHRRADRHINRHRMHHRAALAHRMARAFDHARDDRHLRLQRHDDAALFERQQFASAAARPFRRDS